MSIHIGAGKGEIAPTVLLPGDPLRAKHFAETLLDDPVCFNEVRGMLGYTGFYQGKRVSVMGTGMGIPSHSIYVTELITEYQAKTLKQSILLCPILIKKQTSPDNFQMQYECQETHKKNRNLN